MKKFILVLLTVISKALEVILIKFKTGKEIAECKKAQQFSHFATDFFLDIDTNQLIEKDQKKDVFEYIQSFKDTALNVVLDKFLENSAPVKEVDDIAENVYNAKKDLHLMCKVYERAEYYRDKFNLGADMSVKDIFAEVGKYAESLKQSIKKFGEKEVKKDDEA